MPAVRIWRGDACGNRLLLAVADEASAALEAGEVRSLCRAQSADGLLVLDPLSDPPRLAVRNRDGTDGGVCLNGARLAARWLERERGLAGGLLETGGRHLGWRRDPEERLVLLLPPESLPEEMALRPVDLGGGRRGLAVPWWNPHCVVPVEDVDAEDLETLAGRAAAAEALFPEGVNLELVQDDGPGALRVRVHERGVGETGSCASGAVAVSLVAWMGGGPGPLELRFPGGSLRTRPGPEGSLLLQGPVRLEEAPL